MSTLILLLTICYQLLAIGYYWLQLVIFGVGGGVGGSGCGGVCACGCIYYGIILLLL